MEYNQYNIYIITVPDASPASDSLNIFIDEYQNKIPTIWGGGIVLNKNENIEQLEDKIRAVANAVEKELCNGI